MIRPLSEIGASDAEDVGGKAARLGELVRLGVRVPPGFALLSAAYQAHVVRSGLHEAVAELVAASRWDAVEDEARRRLLATPLDPVLITGILEAWDSLARSALAVRSSAPGEDGAEASFAGQYRSLLDIRSEVALLDAIRLCWASAWGRPVLEYRARRNRDVLPTGMGVVIQAMVPARAAGVLFTVDPVDQRQDRILVQVVAGLGEALVSGTDTGQLWWVDRESLDVVRSTGNGTGVEPEDVAELCRTALAVETHFGCPQDLEFAWAGQDLLLLQARPITTLSGARPDLLPPLPPPTFAEKAILPLAWEHYTAAPMPLDNLVYTRLVGGAVEALRTAGGRVTDADARAFDSVLWRQAYRFPRHRLTWRIAFSGWSQLRALRTDWLAWWMAGPAPALREASRIPEPGDLSDEELVRLTGSLLDLWGSFLGPRMYVAGAYRVQGLLEGIVRLAVGGREAPSVIGDLQRGIDTPVTQANRALWELSRKARAHPTVLRDVRRMDPDALRSTPEGREMHAAVDDFLAECGHREGAAWYLSTPTWGQDPLQVWRILASLSEAETPPLDTAQGLEAYQRARARVDRRLAAVPWLARLFGWLTDTTRSLAAFREQSHFDLTRPLRALQRITEEWGRRLAGRGLLDRSQDVLLLTPREAREWLLGPPPSSEGVARTLAIRRATYPLVNATWQQERSGRTDRKAATSRRGRSAGLTGVATSAGVSVGKVRIITGAAEFHRLRPGEVLVCSYTNPSWTPLFASAAAVVTETGGPASHAAIVAREYGIPCVMGVQGAMRLLEEGREVMVDGRQGRVIPLSPTPGQRSP